MFEDSFGIMDISATALTAERRRLSLIANNIANAETTRGVNGEPYKRKYAVFATMLDNELKEMNSPEYLKEKGVRIDRIMTDESPFTAVYDPDHPDANEKGYVEYPNVNILEEMVDLIAASRAYEANIMVIKMTKGMMNKAMSIINI